MMMPHHEMIYGKEFFLVSDLPKLVDVFEIVGEEIDAGVLIDLDVCSVFRNAVQTVPLDDAVGECEIVACAAVLNRSQRNGRKQHNAKQNDPDDNEYF